MALNSTRVEIYYFFNDKERKENYSKQTGSGLKINSLTRSLLPVTLKIRL